MKILYNQSWKMHMKRTFNETDSFKYLHKYKKINYQLIILEK